MRVWNPPLTGPAATAATALWVASLGFTAVLLWTAHELDAATLAGGAMLVWAMLLLTGWVLQGGARPRASEQPA